jgi:hypothetical protein
VKVGRQFGAMHQRRSKREIARENRACARERSSIFDRRLKFSSVVPMGRRGFISRRNPFMTNYACTALGFLATFSYVRRFEGTRVSGRYNKPMISNLGVAVNND